MAHFQRHLADPRMGASQVLVTPALADSSTLSQLLDVPPVLHTSRAKSSSLPPAFRQRDSTARIQVGPLPKSAEETLEELERRLTYLHEKQAAYDAHSARPRATRRPDSRLERADFHTRVAEVTGPNQAKAIAAERIAVRQATVLQKAQQRHFEWTQRVYEPITGAVGAAVDANKERIHHTRAAAYEGFLRATRSRTGGVFLEDTQSEYDPYTVSRASLRVPVRLGRGGDPTKVLLDKLAAEKVMLGGGDAGNGAAGGGVGRGGGGGGLLPPPGAASFTTRPRARETLEASQWTAAAMEATVHGHFELRDAAYGGPGAGGGGATMAFAGKDTESSVRMDDFSGPETLTRTRDGRFRELDAEFPLGKRVQGYPYRSQPTGLFMPHNSVKGVFSKEDGVFSDEAMVDIVKSETMRARLAADAGGGGPGGGGLRPAAFGRTAQLTKGAWTRPGD